MSPTSSDHARAWSEIYRIVRAAAARAAQQDDAPGAAATATRAMAKETNDGELSQSYHLSR
ncbi:MAG: hypothetical protein AB7R89_11070 [Dehalococcoidia bacterium]